MVIDRATLFADGYFQGFAPAHEINYSQIIRDNYFYEKRGLVEVDPAYKQPIPYCIIANPITKQIFAYQRAIKDAHYAEERLRGKWSWGIGGHIDKLEEEPNDPILTSMLRELQEEVEIPHLTEPLLLGYINDDQTEVGQVHFGLLYLLKTMIKISPKDMEIAWGGYMNYDDLEEICITSEKNVESWSEISLEPIRKALGIGIGEQT